jgi:hypothetical protein
MLYAHKSINSCHIGRPDPLQGGNLFKQYWTIMGWNGRRKKKEIYEEKTDEYGNVIEKKKIEEKEEEDD